MSALTAEEKKAFKHARASVPIDTGKVKIGGAYVPRIRPEASQGFSGPHKRPFFDRPDRIVMRACLVAIVVFALIQLSGCTDRGRCLESHQEEQWYQPPPLIFYFDGKNLTFIPQPGYFQTVTVCDSWEFPEGRKS